ncbi:magnesium and cobalt transport protein CorA [Gottschalkia purinilytica]|uniref:Magnesium transport protein CorA n=1 Tax=Gottschalkia purinilytica TaxID=1503 RepID=A0A0L0WAW2_GOTPU|nr:magnesium/cobalt transporter CorA [Gottschalkia purinilytica]KNF08636.1 magnesium and cobalt transport protein CorA [Gottschalkia purinilytica]
MKQARKHLKKVGYPSGTILYTGNDLDKEVEIELITYSKEKSSIKNIKSLDEMDFSSDDLKWINIRGLHDIDLIKKIGDIFKISNLTLENITHIAERPKVEFYNNYMFLTLKTLFFDEDNIEIIQKQVSFILMHNTLITFQEDKNNTFDMAKKRICENEGLIAKKNIDYLLYFLIDGVVDEYFVALSKIEEKIEDIEESIVGNSQKYELQEVYKLRKGLVIFKALTWPLEDTIYDILNEDSIISEDTKKYLKDVRDHLIQITELVTFYREMILGIFDIHLSNTSNKMNQIMTTLTVFSTIFIPLTFLTGIYGMNFKYMPELYLKWSYPLFWILCLGIIFGMYRFFKNKDWM